MIKNAMLEVDRSEKLNELGYKMVLTAHDEIMGTIPIENAFKAEELVREIMEEVGENMIHIPVIVETEITESWYGMPIEKLE